MLKKVFTIITMLFIILSGLLTVSHRAEAASKTKYVTASVLNVRSGPSTNYKIVTTVKKDQAVVVSQEKGSWSKTTVNKKTGWVSNKYLTTKKPASSKSSSNLAQGLKTVGSNKQLILVTTNGTTTSSAEIRTFEKDSKGKWIQKLSIKGFVGKTGVGKTKEGESKTPVGKYTIGTAFGQKGNPGTKLPFRNITNDDVWVDDPKSKLYNTWQSKKKTKGQWKSAENMNHRLYTYGFVINYNTERTPGKGSAIFFHVGDSYTLGCVATSEANVKSILKWLDPAKKPVIIITSTQDLKKY